MRKFFFLIMVFLWVAVICVLEAAADEEQGGYFNCAVCGSRDHGSLWHDSDKDGKPDR